MLSGWPSSSVPKPRMASRSRGSPRSALAPSRPAARATALAPRPRATGMRARYWAHRPSGASFPTCEYRRRAASAAMRSAGSGEKPAGVAFVDITTSAQRSRAMPRQSKPGPRLAVVAGARTMT